MISKKTLLNGYIKNEEGELMDLFNKAAKYYFSDVEILDSDNERWPFYSLGLDASGCDHHYVEASNLKELTLEDFKPEERTKSELDKLSDLIHRLKMEEYAI